MEDVVAFLASQGINRDDLCLVSSGNGAWIHLPVDLPNDPASHDLVGRFLGALQQRFDGPRGTIDLKVKDASRISKLPLTWTCKGLNTLERPWRLATLLQVPAVRQNVSVAVLEKVASFCTGPAQSQRGTGQQRAPSTLPAGELQTQVNDLQRFFRAFRVVNQPRQTGEGLRFYVPCPWEYEHTTKSAKSGSDVSVFVGAKGYGFNCFHTSGECHDPRPDWTAFREFHDPEKQFRFTKPPRPDMFAAAKAWGPIEDADAPIPVAAKSPDAKPPQTVAKHFLTFAEVCELVKRDNAAKEQLDHGGFHGS